MGVRPTKVYFHQHGVNMIDTKHPIEESELPVETINRQVGQFTNQDFK